jgi:hypothetical protein
MSWFKGDCGQKYASAERRMKLETPGRGRGDWVKKLERGIVTRWIQNSRKAEPQKSAIKKGAGFLDAQIQGGCTRVPSKASLR